jgi:hypothetical protein
MIVRDGDDAYAFIHNPRTSGTSIADYLIKNCGGKILRNVEDYAVEHGVYAEQIKYRPFPNHYIFGFIRNPFSREVTLHKLYCRNTGNVVEFKKWLFDDFPWFRKPQYGYFCDTQGVIKANIFRFEDRSNAIATIASIIGTDAAALESHNVHNGFNINMSYIKQYDNEMIDLVSQRYAVDLKAFGYYFDGYHDVIKEVPFSFNEDTINYNVKPPQHRYVNV